MPLPNENSCRLADPGLFEANSFRRMTMKQKASGKTVGVIIGKKKGESKTSTQALRYPTSNWTPEEAAADCKKNGGSFTAAK